MARFTRQTVLAALLACSGSLLASTAAKAVDVTSVSLLPYAADEFPDPAGLLRGSLDRTKDTVVTAGSERDLRGTRANAQTFVVSADEYGPLGIEISAFVMNFEQYDYDEANTLAVELFSIADPLGETIPSSANAQGSLLASGSGLQIPTTDTGDEAGTAVFHFDAPVHLTPGAYAWRFLPSNPTGTQAKWSLTQDNSYTAGQRYEYTSDDHSGDQPAGFASEDYHFGFIGETFLPELVVDRTTGNVTLENTTSQTIENIMGYSLLSTAGSLDASDAAWNSIADSNPDWEELPSDAFNLSEANLGPEFETISLAPGGTLDLGEVWLRWHYEINDLSMLLGIDDGSDEGLFLPADVVYVGGSGDLDPFAQGDFNFDGAVDEDDFAILAGSLPSTLLTESEREAYIAGDMNGDMAVDFNDIAPFRAAYELHNGAGSFALLGSQAVPEPRSLVLLGLMVGCVALYTRRRQAPAVGAPLASLIGLAAVLLPATSHAALNSATSVNSSDSDPYVLVEGGFELGATVFIDRGHTVTDLPIFMQGLDYVQTANNDRARDASDNFSVDLTFDEGAHLFLSIDGRVGDSDSATPPSIGDGTMDWVLQQGWKPTGMTWVKSDGPEVPFYVYSLQPVGTSLSLFEQDAGNFNMYSISAGLTETILPTLTVNTETGQVSLKNPTQHTLELDYYEILSESNSLDVDNWMSLDEQDSDDGDSPVDGWAQGGSSSDSHLAELVLLGSSTFETDDSVTLGQAYDTSIDGQDLVFQFSLEGEDTRYMGLVEYVTGPVGLEGDFNGDGTVDAADYTVWRNHLGGDDAVLGGNGNNNGVVDAGDYTLWKGNFGLTVGSGALGLTSSQVPEPASVLLLGFAAGGLLYFSRRRS